MRDLLLCEPLLDGGIEDVAFWNGRVLVAEDLADQQRASRTRAQRLGRALGAGVAEGFGVEAAAGPPPTTSVVVAPGRAVNRCGDVLELHDEVDVSLIPPPPAASTGTTVFADCDPSNPPDTIAGVGVYVLVVRPAQGPRASAPAVTFESDGVVRECGPRYSVDGLTFKLVLVDVVGLAEQLGHDISDLDVLRSATGSPERRRFRNVLTHLFLGTIEQQAIVTDPFGTASSAHGALDALRTSGHLSDTDVPLAAMSWTNGGVEFVDAWAVRRELHRSSSTTTALSSWGAAPRRVDGHAAWRSCQEHLDDLLVGTTPIERSTMRLVDHMRYLPSAMLVPLETGGFPGVIDMSFLDGVTSRGVEEPLHLTGSRAVSLLRRSFDSPAHDLDTGEFVWAYGVSENRLRAQGVGGAPVQPFLFLASGHLPYLGDAQFDLARADASNVVLGP